MKISFLFPFWSFLNINHVPDTAPRQHVVIEDVGKKTVPVPRHWMVHRPTTIRFTSHTRHVKQQKVDEYTISIPDLFERLQEHPPEGKFETSIHHYQSYQHHRFSKFITYLQFCQLEKALSDLVATYLQDQNHSYIVYLDDIFIQPMGIRKYWSFPKNYYFVTKENYKDQSVDFVMIEKFENINFL